MTKRFPDRLFLADHLLRDIVGHHLGYNLALADAAKRTGIAPCLVTHRKFPLDLAAGTPCRRIFHTDFRAAPPAWISANHRLLGLLENWCDRQFGSDLKKFPDPGSSDAVFAQMLAPRHFLQWLDWLATRPASPRLFLHLGYRPGRFATPRISSALTRMSPAIKHRVVFVTDSEKLVGAFEQVLGAEVRYLPHIISYDFPPAAAARPPDRPIVVFVGGNARREKGFLEIVQAARAVLNSDAAGRYRFMIQCHDPDPTCAEILRNAPSGERIEWIGRPLDNDEYIRRIREADVLLTPYHLDCYELRTSGVFCEARVAGKPVIASRGSWAGDRIHREGGGWLVQEKDPAGLEAALRALPSELHHAAAEAEALAPQARREFSRDGFIAGLVELYAEGSKHDP